MSESELFRVGAILFWVSGSYFGCIGHYFGWVEVGRALFWTAGGVWKIFLLIGGWVGMSGGECGWIHCLINARNLSCFLCFVFFWRETLTKCDDSILWWLVYSWHVFLLKDGKTYCSCFFPSVAFYNNLQNFGLVERDQMQWTLKQDKCKYQLFF